MDSRKIHGQRGEAMAAKFLEERGFCVIERNWNCRLGEIDLIVSRDGEIRFIEVKLRRSLDYGYPEASITWTKLKHLSRAIECWIKSQKQPPECYQADAIAILAPYEAEPSIVWIERIL